jgi:LysM repeat protein
MSHTSVAKPPRFHPGIKGWLGVLITLLLLYTPFGCSSVSDEEMDRLREETFALEAELAAARQEAAILDRALTSVYKERDQVVDQIARATAEFNGEILPDSLMVNGTAVPAGPRKYRAQTGDSLSGIAQRYGTTVSVLLDLNSFLKSRTNNMVWVGDELSLPGPSVQSSSPDR